MAKSRPKNNNNLRNRRLSAFIYRDFQLNEFGFQDEFRCDRHMLGVQPREVLLNYDYEILFERSNKKTAEEILEDFFSKDLPRFVYELLFFTARDLDLYNCKNLQTAGEFDPDARVTDSDEFSVVGIASTRTDRRIDSGNCQPADRQKHFCVRMSGQMKALYTGGKESDVEGFVMNVVESRMSGPYRKRPPVSGVVYLGKSGTNNQNNVAGIDGAVHSSGREPSDAAFITSAISAVALFLLLGTFSMYFVRRYIKQKEVNLAVSEASESSDVSFDESDIRAIDDIKGGFPCAERSIDSTVASDLASEVTSELTISDDLDAELPSSPPANALEEALAALHWSPSPIATTSQSAPEQPSQHSAQSCPQKNGTVAAEQSNRLPWEENEDSSDDIFAGIADDSAVNSQEQTMTDIDSHHILLDLGGIPQAETLRGGTLKIARRKRKKSFRGSPQRALLNRPAEDAVVTMETIAEEYQPLDDQHSESGIPLLPAAANTGGDWLHHPVRTTSPGPQQIAPPLREGRANHPFDAASAANHPQSAALDRDSSALTPHIVIREGSDLVYTTNSSRAKRKLFGVTARSYQKLADSQRAQQPRSHQTSEKKQNRPTTAASTPSGRDGLPPRPPKYLKLSDERSVGGGAHASPPLSSTRRSPSDLAETLSALQTSQAISRGPPIQIIIQERCPATNSFRTQIPEHNCSPSDTKSREIAENVSSYAQTLSKPSRAAPPSLLSQGNSGDEEEDEVLLLYSDDEDEEDNNSSVEAVAPENASSTIASHGEAEKRDEQSECELAPEDVHTPLLIDENLSPGETTLQGTTMIFEVASPPQALLSPRKRTKQTRSFVQTSSALPPVPESHIPSSDSSDTLSSKGVDCSDYSSSSDDLSSENTPSRRSSDLPHVIPALPQIATAAERADVGRGGPVVTDEQTDGANAPVESENFSAVEEQNKPTTQFVFGSDSSSPHSVNLVETASLGAMQQVLDTQDKSSSSNQNSQESSDVGDSDAALSGADDANAQSHLIFEAASPPDKRLFARRRARRRSQAPPDSSDTDSDAEMSKPFPPDYSSNTDSDTQDHSIRSKISSQFSSKESYGLSDSDAAISSSGDDENSVSESEVRDCTVEASVKSPRSVGSTEMEDQLATEDFDRRPNEQRDIFVFEASNAAPVSESDGGRTTDTSDEFFSTRQSAGGTTDTSSDEFYSVRQSETSTSEDEFFDVREYGSSSGRSSAGDDHSRSALKAIYQALGSNSAKS